jgi:hypothetical protein
MTINIAWVRTLRDCQELVFVSDSRLSGGARTFDYCPKILTFPRNDCAISFAGSSDDAYPLMLQLALSIDVHGPLRRGTIDVPALKTHAVRVFDAMADSIASALPAMPDHGQASAEFIFGGYSWVKKKFELWKIWFDPKQRQFRAASAPNLMAVQRVGKVFLGGRIAHGEAVKLGALAVGGDASRDALNRLVALVTDRLRTGQLGLHRLSLNMEPFEVVRDMLREQNHTHSIGGAPQIVKVYQYSQAGPLAVYWPAREAGGVFLRGRPRLTYENFDSWIFDPDELRSYHPKYHPSDIAPPLGLDHEVHDQQLR